MKYKKQIATGALAIYLLIGGTSVFADTPRDLGIKNVQQVFNRQNKNLRIKNKGRTNVVGIISAITATNFTVEVKNKKTASSLDVQTNASTIYSKNGIKTTASDLTIGQKVIITGNLDKITNTLTAKKVKIVTNFKQKN